MDLRETHQRPFGPPVDGSSHHRGIFAQHIAAHEGRIVDSPGDALLAEFSSVIAAVNCTVDIQREFAGRNASLLLMVAPEIALYLPRHMK